jgi:hypothetical protein
MAVSTVFADVTIPGGAPAMDGVGSGISSKDIEKPIGAPSVKVPGG